MAIPGVVRAPGGWRRTVGALSVVAVVALAAVMLVRWRPSGEADPSDAAATARTDDVATTGASPSSTTTEPLFERQPGQVFTSASDGTPPTTTASRAGSGVTSPPTTDLSVATSSTAPVAPPQDDDAPAVVARPVPGPQPEEQAPAAPPPPWAASTLTTAAGHVSTDVGCAAPGLPGGAALDAYFAGRVGPVIGWDYQHVYPLGGERFLWLFQDAFIDHSGGATTLAQASFAHNVALVQDGGCFRLLHGGSVAAPAPFEPGTGSATLSTWFWPMGGEVHDGRLYVFWARMVKDAYDPPVPDGLGWHPADTWIATYDPTTLARLDFRQAPNASPTPIYGYAVASDADHTYLFGNTFEQNLAREGGYWAGQHSATAIFLARVPRGQLFASPEYRTASGWSPSPADAVPVLRRHWAEFPLQPRFIDGQWVAVAAVDGYWGDAFSADVANQPWGPWTTTHAGRLLPRDADPKMNTYHAHLMPWRDGLGNLVVTVSNNARDMRRDAWGNPYRYRPMAFVVGWVAPPPDPPPTAVATTTPTTTPPPRSTSTTTTSTSIPPATSSTSPQPSSTTTAGRVVSSAVGAPTGDAVTSTSSEPASGG